MRPKYDVCIIGGCGHVGLPLGLSFAEKGFNVIAYDINKNSCAQLAKRTMPFFERGAQAILDKTLNKTFFVSPDIDVVKESLHLILAIGTPIDEYLNPKVNTIFNLLDSIMPYVYDQQIFILRSTVPPGTTEKVFHYFRDRGKKIGVAFTPERITQGHAIAEIGQLPQIISGFDRETVQRVWDLFSHICLQIIELTPIEAELAKLFTNAWRYINFAIANQFFIIANNYGLDFHKIYDALTKDYPRMMGFAKPGFTAGPCLLKDTMQLSAFNNNEFSFGHTAMLINEGLPNYIVNKLKGSTNLKFSTVGILGMAFKANCDDKRDALSYKLKKILELEAKQVLCSDAYIKEKGFVEPDALLRDSDIIILAIPHDKYKNLDFQEKRVIDIWNFFGKGGRTL